MPANQLSELPDRPWLLDELGRRRTTPRADGGLTAVVVVKVERLQDFSIELGYSESDELLSQVVERIADCLRETDVFARLTTTEFVAILPGLRSPSQPRMAVSKIESTIKASELDARYQPIIDINTGEVTSVELLARWTSTSHGPVPPRVFVEMVDKCGLMIPLTLWTLNTGSREWAEWQSVLPHEFVTINLSATVLSDPHLLDLVVRALRVWDIAIGQLTVE
jgi:predicted signal transduction protein with EAL and GGDEF domain